LLFLYSLEDTFGTDFVHRLSHAELPLQDLRLISQLKMMYLSGFNLVDLEPLRLLKRLKVLYSKDNDFTNIEPLSELQDLEEVGFLCFGSQNPSYLPLQNLSKLKYLSFEIQSVEELEMVLNMPQLQEFNSIVPFEINPILFLKCSKLKKLIITDCSDDMQVREITEKQIQELRSKGIDLSWIRDYASGLTYEF
jgi:Leucine-rich repeat (LRR) protein